MSRATRRVERRGPDDPNDPPPAEAPELFRQTSLDRVAALIGMGATAEEAERGVRATPRGTIAEAQAALNMLVRDAAAALTPPQHRHHGGTTQHASALCSTWDFR